MNRRELPINRASRRSLSLGLMFHASVGRWVIAPIARVAMLLAVAVSGCTRVVTDVATISHPGRHEVSLPGSGVTLGGILFRPANAAKPLPAIIVLHGWGEPGVPGAPRVEGTARRLSEQGYVALALSMRGWPPSSGHDDCGAEQPDDVAKAADWLATLPGVNADYIGVLGFSLAVRWRCLAVPGAVESKPSSPISRSPT